MRNLSRRTKKCLNKINPKLVTIDECCLDYIMDIAKDFSNKKLNRHFQKNLKGISSYSVSTIPTVSIKGTKSIIKQIIHLERINLN